MNDVASLSAALPLVFAYGKGLLPTVGTNADHAREGRDAIVALSALVVGDELLEVAQAGQLLAHLLFYFRAYRSHILGEEDFAGLDELLAAIDATIEGLDVLLLGGIAEGQPLAAMAVVVLEDEGVEAGLLLVEAQSALDLRELELRLHRPDHHRTLLRLGFDQKFEESLEVTIVLELARGGVGTTQRHDGRGTDKLGIDLEQTLDGGQHPCLQADAQEGGANMQQQGWAGLAQRGELQATHEDVGAEGGGVHLLHVAVDLTELLIVEFRCHIAKRLAKHGLIELRELIDQLLDVEQAETALLQGEADQLLIAMQLLMELLIGLILNIEQIGIGCIDLIGIGQQFAVDVLLLQAITQGQEQESLAWHTLTVGSGQFVERRQDLTTHLAIEFGQTTDGFGQGDTLAFSHDGTIEAIQLLELFELADFAGIDDMVCLDELHDYVH